MKKLLLSIAVMYTLSSGITAQEYTPSPENIQARKEFSQQRFGIFIHWGIYSMLGQGEWVMNNVGIPYNEYSRIAAGFCPSKFNAEEWVKAIKDSGAKYITFTSRHHDGFSMFDTKASDYNIVKATPLGRDIIGELAEACHKENIKLHFYYSHLDWGRNDYWPLGNTGHKSGRPEGKDGDWQHYLDFIDAQLTELLTNYGPIGAIWFDGVWDKAKAGYDAQPEIWNLYGQYELIHKLQPACLVGNNHHLTPFAGEDIQIFERDLPGENLAGLSGQEVSRLPLETCQTMNDNWGYRISDIKYKTPEYCIKYLVRIAGKGANLLLNIGPRPDGTIPDEALNIMEKMGQWLDRYGETIYGTDGGCIPEKEWGITTQKDNILYLHILDRQPSIFLPLSGNKVVSAVSFDNGAKVKFTQIPEGIVITVPEVDEGTIDQIITLKFKNTLK